MLALGGLLACGEIGSGKDWDGGREGAEDNGGGRLGWPGGWATAGPGAGFVSGFVLEAWGMKDSWDRRTPAPWGRASIEMEAAGIGGCGVDVFLLNASAASLSRLSLSLLRFPSSSPSSRSSSMLLTVPLRMSRTYARLSRASCFRFWIVFFPVSSLTSPSSSRRVSTIHPTVSPSFFCNVRTCATSRSISFRVRGSQGGRSPTERSGDIGYIALAGCGVIGSRPSAVAISGRFFCNQSGSIPVIPKQGGPTHLQFRNCVHDRLVDP